MRLPLVLAALLSSVCPALLPAQALAGSRPNILFVFSDDHACRAIGAYGSRFGATPHLDKLAANGVLFTANYCGNALCGPSRATILTGLHSHSNGFCRNGNVFDGSQTTFPKLLQRAGYQTAIVGKWHLESEPTGFDHWLVLPDQGQYYNPDFLGKGGRVSFVGHATNLTTRFAIEWLERRDPKRPFLLMCQHKAPHRNWLPAPEELGLFRGADLPEPATLFDDHKGRMPARCATEMEIARHMTLHYDLMVPPTDAERASLSEIDRSYTSQRARMNDEQRAAWDAAFAAEDAAFRRENPQGQQRVRWMYQRYIKNYLRCVAGVDRSVGELLAWLDAHPDVKANTLVVYASDQGFFLGEHGYYDKRWMDEECFQMPLMMQWPGHLAGGRKIAQLTQNIDFAPTFLELAGVPVPPGMHGKSLVPLLEGREVPWRDAVYYHYYESQATHRVPAMYGVRTATHKLVRYYEPQWNCEELFDLVADPDERQNLAGDVAHAEVLAALQKRLAALRAEYGDDTGELGGGAFAHVAGIARVVRDGEGFRVWANALGGFLLRSTEPARRVHVAATMRSVAAKPLRNGFVVVRGDAGAEAVRGGIEFGARKLVLVLPGAERRRLDVPIEWDGKSAVEVELDIDLDGGRVVVKAAGQELRAELAAKWQAITAQGYGASNTETWFGELRRSF
ncbi:MAG TPA: sulfatase [Planctomycetota bacterium]|nr:sulfatase [Planctomycetota bacterium]